MSGRTHVRLADVAERAEVSIMTVSRVLRTPQQVSADTLKRVNKAIRELGYVPNSLAGDLRAASPSKLVAAIVPSIMNSLFAETLKGLSDTLRSNGIHLMLGDSEYSQKEEEALIAAFLAQRPSGLVLHNSTHTPSARRMLKRAGVPVVEVGNLTPRPTDLVVSYSNFDAARLMTEHLIARGYRKIAFASVLLEGNERAQERRRGYLHAIDAAGLERSDDLMFAIAGSFDNGGIALTRLTDRRPDIDAVFLAGDVLAIGAMLECRRRGWKVPERMAIAGFDDWEFSRHFDTPITTLAIPRYDIGRIAAELILERLKNPSAVGKPPVDVGFELIHRGST